MANTRERVPAHTNEVITRCVERAIERRVRYYAQAVF
ncbi:MAG: hypothetical protein QOH67_5096 [Hyphomicrobiales bacterium]|jgi:hypothetical protein|nr:hypothetical protein [Hyphomicrobiales bacterium]